MGGETDTYFTIRSLAIHSMSFFAMFNLAYGIATPGGIFMPSIMVNFRVFNSIPLGLQADSYELE